MEELLFQPEVAVQIALSLVPPALQMLVCVAVHLPRHGSLTEIHAIGFR